MSSSPESEATSGALLDGDAVQDALEQFDTLVDLDRRVEDAAAATAPRADDAPPDPTGPQRTVATTVATTEAATAGRPHASGREPKMERETTPELVPAIEARVGPKVDVAEVGRRVEMSLVDQGPRADEASRPKLVPRSAEPELVGIDGDELAWADDPSGSSRPVLGAVVITVLLLGAAGVIFAPQWLERGAPAAAPLADIDPIAYRAPKRSVASQLAIAPPRAGGVAGEPLPRLPAAASPETGPALLASAVAPPPPIRRAATAPAPSPSAAPPAARSAAPSALRSPGSRPRTRDRIEPSFTAEDALEQDGPRIVLRVLVDERGAPVRVMVEEGVPGTAGVSKAIDAVLRTRYEAGRRQGEPVRAWRLETFDLPAGE